LAWKSTTFHPPDILSANDNAQEPSTQAEAEFALHSRVSTALAPRHSRSVISPSPERHLNPSVPFPPHTAYNELVGFHTPNGTPRVPSPTPPYFDLYYQADVPDYFIDPDSLVEHFAGTTLSVEPTPDLSSVPGAFSPSPSSPNLLSPLLPSSSAPAVSGGSQDGLTSDNSEDDASSVDAHLSASSRTSPVPVPYTPAQQITATNPTICPLITTLAPLVTHTMEGHTNWVTSVAFLSNGLRIVSGSDVKTCYARN
jgi:hypothetical protein